MPAIDLLPAPNFSIRVFWRPAGMTEAGLIGGDPRCAADYNHYEVSVTVANLCAVFGRHAIDMMRFDTVIETGVPGYGLGARSSILAFPSIHPGTQRPQQPPFVPVRPPV
jgi:hypothetical protein